MFIPPPKDTPRWMGTVLLLAGIYNLAWGSWVVFFPNMSFEYSGLNQPDKPLDYPQLWQCIGMIVGVYGIGYIVAASNPLRHWPIVLVGFLGKLFGPMGYVYGVIVGETRPEAIATILFNDLIWWVPFFLILKTAYLRFVNEHGRDKPLSVEEATRQARDNHGVTMAELAADSKLFVLFLRHFGCTYCREAVADLAKQRAVLESQGHKIAVVHMGTAEAGDAFFQKYGLADISHFSDPECQLYRAFGLKRGRFGQLFSLKAFARFVPAGIIAGHGFGPMQGDGTRMPGAFVLENGEIRMAHRPESPADKLDFCELAGCQPAGTLAGS